jgi:RNA polymerase sigma-70 factor (ECF subfamily)
MTDEELTRFHAGDDALFRRLVRELSPRLLGAALHLTHDRAAAHDLVHETWVHAFQSRHTFAQRGSLLGWLLAVMRTCHRSTVRADVRRDARAAVYAGNSTDTSSATPAPADTIDERSIHAQFLDALAELSPRQRDVVVCRILEDRSVAETAARLGMAEGTVKATLAQAIRRLRDRLGVSMP